MNSQKPSIIANKMKLQIQTLSGRVGEVEADPRDTILDLKVCTMNVKRSTNQKERPKWVSGGDGISQLLGDNL